VAPVPKQRFFKVTNDKGRDSKRRKTSHVLDTSAVEDKSTMNRNIILPLDRLVSFLESNFVCKCCCNKLTTFDDEKSKPPLGFDIFGIACGLNFNCRCGAQDSLRPKVVDESLQKIGPNDKKPIGNRLNSGDFEINKRLHLGLQLCGNGRHDGAILAGMLKLNVNSMR
jgi:hypothetical protein